MALENCTKQSFTAGMIIAKKTKESSLFKVVHLSRLVTYGFGDVKMG